MVLAGGQRFICLLKFLHLGILLARAHKLYSICGERRVQETKGEGMYNFFRGMTIAAIVFALTGCAGGELSLGSFSPPVKREFVINGSSFDESFQVAHRIIEESDLDIYSSNRDVGKIDAGIDRSTNTTGDSRSFTTNFVEFKYELKETEPGRIVFNVEAKSNRGGNQYIDRFAEEYSKYVKFSEITSEGAQAFGARAPKIESLNESGESQQIISEIKTGDPVIRTKKLSLSKQEIIEVQIVLQKLGYYTGSADGTMNSETMNAIEKFKAENGAIRKLF
jgi:hypothetical protein